MCFCDRVLAAPGRPTVATRQAGQAGTSSHRPLRSGAYSELFAAITAAVRALSADVILDLEAAFCPPGSIVRTLRLAPGWPSSRPDPRASRNASGGARFYNPERGPRACVAPACDPDHSRVPVRWRPWPLSSFSPRPSLATHATSSGSPGTTILSFCLRRARQTSAKPGRTRPLIPPPRARRSRHDRGGAVTASLGS